MSFSSGVFSLVSGNPVVTGTTVSSTWANNTLTDIATGLSTCILKDGTQTTTVLVPFAQGINSTLVTDSTSSTTGSIITAGGIGIAKALFVGTNITASGTLAVTGTSTLAAVNASGNINVNAGKFTAASADGSIAVNTNEFTVNGTTGVTVINGSQVASALLTSNFNGASAVGAVLNETANTSGCVYLYFMESGVAAGYVQRVTNTSAINLVTTSDANLKNIKGNSDAVAAHARLMAYQMRDFEWKDNLGINVVGPIAQEIYAINPDPMLVTPAREYVGEKLPWTINMSGFIPDMIMTIQQQDSILKSLRADFDAYVKAHP